MIRLKLNLEEGTVNYNEQGQLTSTALPNVPNQIKSFGIPVEIKGYIGNKSFFVYSLTSPQELSQLMSSLHFSVQLDS